MPEVGTEFPEGPRQVVLAKEIEPDEIQHGKAGGVREVPGHPVKVEGIQFHAAGGMSAPADLAADLRGFKVQVGEKRIEEGGFPDARRAGERCGVTG